MINTTTEIIAKGFQVWMFAQAASWMTALFGQGGS
jgi:hypothetical protein